jgi:hypothetical protein
VFWQSLHRHAIPLAPFLNLLNPDYFEIDRELINRAALARTIPELNEEIRDYAMDFRNQGGLRRMIGLRLSTRRLRKLAGPYLPAKPGKGAAWRGMD